MKQQSTDLAAYNESINNLIKITEPEVPFSFDSIEINNKIIPIITRELWTSRQRQSHSLHEISYRACFKAELPRFFISKLTSDSEIVYDPFAGRGTTALESAFLGRKVISNDINPLSKILSRPRLAPPNITSITDRLKRIPKKPYTPVDNHLSMFFHDDTFQEISALREYFIEREGSNSLDDCDSWIRMVATNRLTGHSSGFFSVYTLPPNQAASIDSQIKINKKYNQTPDYKNTYEILIKKSRTLLADLQDEERPQLLRYSKSAKFLTKDARNTPEIEDECVALTVTSPPFLDIVQYADDNWLRCWFNNLNVKDIEEQISTPSNPESWQLIMKDVFSELYRITKFGGHVAFEVGEIRRGRIQMENLVIPIAMLAGFHPVGVLLNEQVFTKTSHIWGIANNSQGTNTNRIILLKKLQ
jgi:DNA modification methylase